MSKIPPKVEYSLTNKGETLLPVLEQLCERGEKTVIIIFFCIDNENPFGNRVRLIQYFI
ncbi:DNA-binding HxlR family transcriptional regulator [Rummeliibacillus stabekisii]|nr:DNA-binding HxlR family transcriptional regulator [Rummeliibacillus stabekisii]GEL05534.1 hypothetical protein RST01_21610 [Rummeliibacillus stabekisii]